jgi:glutaredoxin
MSKYTVWSKNNCTFCQQAKSLLLIKGADFEVKMLDQDYDMMEFAKRFPSARTFPAIEVDGDYIGGFEQLKETF